MSDVLFVGRSPSWIFDGNREPFAYGSGRVLAHWMGVSLADFRRDFDRVHLLDSGRSVHVAGDEAYDIAAATERAAGIAAGLTHKRVVLVGKFVAQAFGIKRPSPFSWFDYGYDLDFRSVSFSVVPQASQMPWRSSGWTQMLAARWVKQLTVC